MDMAEVIRTVEHYTCTSATMHRNVFKSVHFSKYAWDTISIGLGYNPDMDYNLDLIQYNQTYFLPLSPDCKLI